ncbi:MAG: magnesium transporter [Opitutales bacterium]|nr:magnesium transporter [Opitutales bacterium]
MILVPEKLKELRLEMAGALAEGRAEEAASLAARISVGRAADMLAQAPREHIVPCLRKMKPDRAGEIIARMPTRLVADVLSAAKAKTAFALLKHVPVDRVADITPLLAEQRRTAYIGQLSEEDRGEIESLERYTAEEAGALMTTDFFAVDEKTPVGEVIAAVESLPVHHEQRSDIYVIDSAGTPVGMITLRELLSQETTVPVGTVMNRRLAVVPDRHPAEEAARMLLNRRQLSLPVIDTNNAMIGIITLDDAARALNRSLADQFTALNAASKEESFFTPPMGSVRMRLPWMAANIFLNLGAVFIISGFEDTIAQVAILAAFLPMITDMGGNVGIQALSVSIRSIALGEARLNEFWKATRKEILIGLVNGAALGVLFAVVAYVLQGNAWMGLVAGIALACNVFLAGIVGGTLPFFIKKMGKDPAMMTGPVLTTITDITGVTIYLGLSTLFIVKILGAG